MSITTYTELKTAVADWLARDDLTSFIPEFISNAESKLNRTLYHPGMETRVTVTTVSTSDEPQYVSLPTGFQSMRRLRVNSVDFLPSIDFVSEAQANRYRTSIANASGQPRFYTIFGDEIELIPTPDTNYELEMVYRSNLTALSTSNTSNWLLTLAPDVYLYGALLQAAPFVQDPDSFGIWGGLYTSGLDELNKAGRALKYGQTPVRVTTGSVVPP